MGEMPGSRSQEASPRKKGSSGLVMGNSYGHNQMALTVLKVPGAGACEREMHVSGGQG
jgi:hypothetical protein